MLSKFEISRWWSSWALAGVYVVNTKATHFDLPPLFLRSDSSTDTINWLGEIKWWDFMLCNLGRASASERQTGVCERSESGRARQRMRPEASARNVSPWRHPQSRRRPHTGPAPRRKTRATGQLVKLKFLKYLKIKYLLLKFITTSCFKTVQNR